MQRESRRTANGVATATPDLADAVRRLLAEKISREVTHRALEFLQVLFAAGAEAVGSTMAGRAEQGVGQPDVVAASVSLLAQDLLAELEHARD